MKKEDIVNLYMKKSGCSREYAENNSKGYLNFANTLNFILSNVHQSKMRDMESVITQCERYPEEKTGVHVKLIRGVFNKLKREIL